MIRISPFLGHRARTLMDSPIGSPRLASLLPTKTNRTKNVKYTKDYEEKKMFCKYELLVFV